MNTEAPWLLETISESDGTQERLTQRKLALRAGLSLGMTNPLCKLDWPREAG